MLVWFTAVASHHSFLDPFAICHCFKSNIQPGVRVDVCGHKHVVPPIFCQSYQAPSFPSSHNVTQTLFSSCWCDLSIPESFGQGGAFHERWEHSYFTVLNSSEHSVPIKHSLTWLLSIMAALLFVSLKILLCCNKKAKVKWYFWKNVNVDVEIFVTTLH